MTDFQAFHPIIATLVVLFSAYYVYKSIRKPGFKQKIRDEEKLRNAEEHRLADESALGKALPAVEHEIHEEDKEITEVIPQVSELDTLMKRERTLVPLVASMLNRAEHDNLVSVEEGGLPEEKQFEDIWRRENELLNSIWRHLIKPEPGMKKVITFLKDNERGLESDTARVVHTETNVRAEGGEDNREKRTIKFQNREIRLEEHAMKRGLHNETGARDEIWNTRKKIRSVYNLNKDMLRITEARRSGNVKFEEKVIKKLAKDIHRKADFIGEIVVNIKSIHEHEKELEHATQDVIHYNRAVMRPAA